VNEGWITCAKAMKGSELNVEKLMGWSKKTGYFPVSIEECSA
jgi:hypothetical protein